MKKAIFLRLISVSTLTVLIFSVVLSLMLQGRYEKDLRQNMLTTLSAAVLSADRTTVPKILAERLSAACAGIRITIILPDGTVSADTATSELPLENYYNLPEVIQARATGKGYFQRHSSTLGENYLYVTLRSPEKTIYRAAQPVQGLGPRLQQLMPATLTGLALAILFSFIVASRTAASVIKPIEKVSAEIMKIREGDYSVKLKDPEYEELSPLTSSINSLVRGIVSTLENLEGEKEKLGFVLDNMKQGLVVIDSNLKILLCNNAAKSLFNNTGHFTGKPLLHLTHNPKIVTAVENSIKSGVSTIFNIPVDYFEKVYSVSVNHVSASWVDNGSIIILTDVTQSSKMEQMRSEFVANASHELKTPITSISGFAELLASGIVTDDAQFKDYLQRIVDESTRITALLEDILKLASLENTVALLKREPVDLLDCAGQAVKALMPQAEAGKVSIAVSGDKTVLSADPTDMRHLISNLIENAIKYNKVGGSVKVHITSAGETAQISVADTGIGIPEKDIPRIFERFYRVDKGRSRSVGGTGLGLSIVKHIVALYSGDIQVKSKIDDGTEIIVSFPMLSI
ncbi:MAG: ATP-binding protein [Eubacteriales bacterium]